VARREEWREQVALALLLNQWMDPADSFWSAFDPVAGSAMSGLMRKRRGVRRGVPDNWIVYKRRLITIEMKSRTGRCSVAQRAVREALIRAGGLWWQCITARSAMWALKRSGVRFRTIVHADGRTEGWRAPRLPLWEQPRRDPAERRPNAPEVVAERREVARRWRERKRARAVAAAHARALEDDSDE
jgi:hypothetical protein